MSVGGAGLAAARAERAGDPEVTFAPSGLRVVAKPGATLLELAEGAEQRIEAGCRMGVCGADPVCIVAGMEHLSPIGADEQARSNASAMRTTPAWPAARGSAGR